MRRNVKSVCGRKYVHVASCTGKRVHFVLPKTDRMKIIEELQIDRKMCWLRNIAGALLTCIMFVSCSACATQESVNESELSWKIYCEKYDVNQEEPTDWEYDWYLDCYSGSAEEDEDIADYINY